MWKTRVDRYDPPSLAHQNRITMTSVRDQEDTLDWADTSDIFLYQLEHDDEVFLRVCSSADLQLTPTSATALPTDILRRRNAIDLVFRSKDLSIRGVDIIIEDIELLADTIRSLKRIEEAAGFTP
jgi:hypothetical protein